jgi:hypothetical protein
MFNAAFVLFRSGFVRPVRPVVDRLGHPADGSNRSVTSSGVATHEQSSHP